MAKQKQLTRTMYITEATVTYASKSEKAIKTMVGVKLFGEYPTADLFLAAVRNAWSESEPDSIPISVEGVSGYKATYAMPLDVFLAHAQEVVKLTADSEQLDGGEY